MELIRRIRQFWECFFPLRLLFAHLKYNLIACLYWVVLFAIIADKFATNYGVPYLFLSPEYKGEVSWLSFFFVGLSVGGLTIAFNIYSYMIMGKIYPFISTLGKPFFKFCLNNAFIPLIFCIFYLVKATQFQRYEELATWQEILVFDLSFVLGFLTFVILSFLYFFPTNKDVFKISGDQYRTLEDEPISSIFHKQEDWTKFRSNSNRKYIYFQSFFTLKLSRSIKHYDRKLLERVFTQNYINATVFEIVTIIAFFSLGLFKEIPAFQIPAGMSVIMLMTVVLMLFSIFSSWFRKWTYPFLILLVFSINVISKHTSLFQYNTYAYGLNYDKASKNEYAWPTIQKVADDSLANEQSLANIKSILENWKKNTGIEKPKLVLVMTSGGGLRSSLWTYEVMQHLDSISNEQFSKHLHLITGASGGMIGAAYYRSIQLEKQINKKFVVNKLQFSENVSKDLLNTLALSASVNDLFFRISKFNIDGKEYSKDRAYSFEHQLHKNTNGLMDKPLKYFEQFERQAKTPLLVLSPTIVNDGRRLIISSQSLNFMSHATGNDRLTKSYENIDLHNYFKDNTPQEMRLSTALRMSATFPYILPMTSLPTSPKVEVMDAGIRDNYGGKITLEYLYELKDWIKENTSGVLIVQVRDKKKLLVDEKMTQVSIIDKLGLPAFVMMKNFTKTQDYDIDEMMKFALTSFDFPTDIVTFNLKEAVNTRISLSWHLTKNEKKIIKEALKSEYNQEEFTNFLKLIRN